MPLFKYKNCNGEMTGFTRAWEFYRSPILIWRIPWHFKFRVELHVVILGDTRFAADYAIPDTSYWFSLRARPALTGCLRFFLLATPVIGSDGSN